MVKHNDYADGMSPTKFMVPWWCPRSQSGVRGTLCLQLQTDSNCWKWISSTSKCLIVYLQEFISWKYVKNFINVYMWITLQIVRFESKSIMLQSASDMYQNVFVYILTPAVDHSILQFVPWQDLVQIIKIEKQYSLWPDRPCSALVAQVVHCPK